MSEPIKPKRYFCLFNDDAVSQGYLNAEDSREYGSSIFRRNDDGTVTLVGEDGGEPEDQTLNRDWKWVIEALNAEAERNTRPEPDVVEQIARYLEERAGESSIGLGSARRALFSSAENIRSGAFRGGKS